MPESPFDSPVPRGLRVIQATLRVTVAVVCWGWAARQLHLKVPSPVAGLLDSWLHVDPARVAGIESITSYALIAVGIITLIRPCWFVLLPANLWLTLAAVGVGIQSDEHKLLAALEHAAGAVAPLALMLIDFWPPRVKFSLGMHATGLWLLRIGASVAFIAQGTHALIQGHFGGPWHDVMAQALDHLARREFSDRDVSFALAVLGACDIAVGFALWIRRSRIAAIVAALVGIVAAGFFTAAFGETRYADTLIRAAIIGGPATLLCHWWLAIIEEPPTVVARNEFR